MSEKNWILVANAFGDDIAGKITYLGSASIKLGSSLDWDLGKAVEEVLEELGVVRVEIKRITMRLIHDKDKYEPGYYRP